MQTESILRRKDAVPQSTWDIDSVFPSWEAWEAELAALKAESSTLTDFAGRLGDDATVLADWLEIYSNFRRRAMKVRLYPYMHTVVDSHDAESKGKLGQAMGVIGQMLAATAFAEPEIMAVGEALFAWAESEPRLAVYRHYFDDLLRQKAHRRSAEVEEVLGMLADPFSGAFQTYGDLTNSDLDFGEAEDSAGNRYPIQQSNLRTHLHNPDRTRRRTAWENFNDAYVRMQNTLAANYIAHVKQSVFQAQVRGYDSVLALMLDPFNIPLDVFHNLLDTFKQNLPVWHRYWDAKRRLLGVETLYPYDIWAPLTTQSPPVTYAQAVDWIAAGMRPLGDDYVSQMRRALVDERWVDWAPNAEKRQGAQSLRAKNVHPFLWLSFDDSLGGMSTLAHEIGHSMHSHLADSRQPELYADYNMIAAETASNFNQAMTRAYLIEEKADDAHFQLGLIDEAMDNFHRYFFIMPTLARFELEVYTRAEQGKPLTVNVFNDLCADFFAEGYGDTLTDDRPRTASTWAQFLHLYMPYYTFQYSVGISAAHALSARILNGTPNAAADYLQFLHAGSSLYPAELFTLAGVDVSTPTSVEATFGVLSGLVDRLESLI